MAAETQNNNLRKDLDLICSRADGYEDAIVRVLEQNQDIYFNLDSLGTLYECRHLLTRVDYALSLLKAMDGVSRMVDTRVADIYFRLLRSCFENLGNSDCDFALRNYYQVYGSSDNKMKNTLFVPALNEKKRDPQLFTEELPNVLDDIRKSEDPDCLQPLRDRLVKLIAFGCILSSRVTVFRLLTSIISEPTDILRDSLLYVFGQLPSLCQVYVSEQNKPSQPLLVGALMRLATNNETVDNLKDAVVFAKLTCALVRPLHGKPAPVDATIFVNDCILPKLKENGKTALPLLCFLYHLFDDRSIIFQLQLKSVEANMWDGGDETQTDTNAINAPELFVALTENVKWSSEQVFDVLAAFGACLARKMVQFSPETVQWLLSKIDTNNAVFSFHLPRIWDFGEHWKSKVSACTYDFVQLRKKAKYGSKVCESHPEVPCVIDNLFALMVCPAVAQPAVKLLLKDLNWGVLLNEFKKSFVSQLALILARYSSVSDWATTWDLVHLLVRLNEPQTLHENDHLHEFASSSEEWKVAECYVLFANAMLVSMGQQQQQPAFMDRLARYYNLFMTEKVGQDQILTDANFWKLVDGKVAELASLYKAMRGEKDNPYTGVVEAIETRIGQLPPPPVGPPVGRLISIDD